jgi:hypothetical protein
MFEGKFQCLKIAMVAAGIVTSSQGAEFVAPAEGPVAFRRDKVPLDVVTMGDLSAQLTELAYALPGTTAAELRGAAQMLAVATTLDPGNTRARGLIEDFRRNRRRPDPDMEKVAKDRLKVWETTAWLETGEGGPDGQALAKCLKDVISLSDPENPKAKALLAGGPQGAWDGWIPPVTSYEGGLATGSKPDPAGGKTGVATAVALKAATVSTCVPQQITELNSKVTWTQELVPLEMSATAAKSRQETPFTVVIGESAGTSPLAKVAADVVALLASVHGTLPDGVELSIDGKGLKAASRAGKPATIQAAAVVLASAAITGKEPDGTILGAVDASGNYTVTPGFWEQLRAVEKGKGGRLILPAGAADYLTAMLAFEKASFFLRYEVLLAKDFKQLLELSAKEPESEYAVPFGQFAEIRAKATPQSVGSYLTNSFVRRRLTEISQAAPSHYSAKMLLIQGSGNRPTLIPRAVMVSEIRRALEPVAEVAQSVNQSATFPGDLGAIYESCRSALDGLQRYAGKEERPLLGQAQELVAVIRTMDRVSRTKSGSYDNGSLYETQMGFIKLFNTVSTTLEAGGEPPLLAR